MIRSSVIFSGILCFLSVSFSASGALSAKEYTLTFEKAAHNPVAFFGAAPIEAGEKGNGWLEGGDFMTSRATSVTAHLSLGNLGFTTLLMTVDKKEEGAEYPDTLHADLNRNRILDEGETFPLVLVDNEGAGPVMPFTMLCAEKVAYRKEGPDEGAPLYVNFYHPIIEDAPPGFGLAFGLSAWGCYTGRITLDGVAYDVTLEDRTVNGAYDDFDEGARFDCDSLTLERADKPKVAHGMTPPPALRHKMLLGDQAYSVAVKEKGKILSLDPIAVDRGSVSVSPADVAVNLSNPEWGGFRIAPGEKKVLPAGKWTIADYSREKNDGSCMCNYSEPTEIEVTVAKGESVRLDLATALVAKVSASRRAGLVRLNLSMATAGGATFRGYFSAAGGRGGIPFSITDAAGEIVEKGTFEFG